jgi:hypothetical protein
MAHYSSQSNPKKLLALGIHKSLRWQQLKVLNACLRGSKYHENTFTY